MRSTQTGMVARTTLKCPSPQFVGIFAVLELQRYDVHDPLQDTAMDALKDVEANALALCHLGLGFCFPVMRRSPCMAKPYRVPPKIMDCWPAAMYM